MTELAIDAVMTVDKQGAHEIIAMKDEINKLIDSASIHQIDRLTVHEPDRLALYTIEIDTIEKFKRIYYFAKRIAKSVMKANLEPEQDTAE
jgi:phosphate:Na+ symporter